MEVSSNTIGMGEPLLNRRKGGAHTQQFKKGSLYSTIGMGEPLLNNFVTFGSRLTQQKQKPSHQRLGRFLNSHAGIRLTKDSTRIFLFEKIPEIWQTFPSFFGGVSEKYGRRNNAQKTLISSQRRLALIVVFSQFFLQHFLRSYFWKPSTLQIVFR